MSGRSSLVLAGAASIGVAAVLAGYVMLRGSGRHRSAEGALAGCRNHATFVVFAISDHIARHGWLPYDGSRHAEDVLRDVLCKEPAFTNCYAAAPDARCGGWQFPNWPLSAWKAVFLDFKPTFWGRDVPIAWCGKPHASKDGPVRFVVAFGDLEPADWGEGGLRNDVAATAHARLQIHLMRDEELAGRLTAMEETAVKHGAESIEMDTR